MRHIHSREHLNEGDVVVIDCDTQSNCCLTTDSDYSSYKRGGRHTYYGGHFKYFPAKIVVPHSGYWNITIDVGGSGSGFKYSINVRRG